MRSLTQDEIRDVYIRRKLKDLHEFGYPRLTMDEVAEQYDKVAAGESGLTVIGMFIKSDFDDAKRRREASS